MHHRTKLLGMAALTAILLLGGCSSANDVAPSKHPDDAHLIGHVHGLGVDPADGTLYAAGHYGVFRIGEDGTPIRVADRWQDTMAFTVTGPRTFLGSGHSDLREDLPPHLGLIESTDAGETWQPLSLQGEADFHALEVVGDTVFGYDSTSRQILVTTDRSSWDTVATGEFIDLAPVPGHDDRIMATTGAGQLVEISLDGRSQPVSGAPTLVWVDATPGGQLVGTSPRGEVAVTTDSGSTWQRTGRAPGTPTALDAIDNAWHIATDKGIYASTDRGRTWIVVVETQH